MLFDTQLIAIDYLWFGLLFIAALCHTSVGLAGGTSYAAILSASGLPVITVTSASLSLNTLASTIGAFNFTRFKHFKLNLLLPFLISSAPSAYLGAKLVLPQLWFYLLLLLTLSFCVLSLVSNLAVENKTRLAKRYTLPASVALGAGIGFISGCIGIGGGIFLVPLIASLGLAPVKQAAACGVVFIWCNSLVGLYSRFESSLIQFNNLFLVLVIVGTGSAIGSYLGASRFPLAWLKGILVAVLLFAFAVLSYRLYIELQQVL